MKAEIKHGRLVEFFKSHGPRVSLLIANDRLYESPAGFKLQTDAPSR
jgi:hypothetical protein